jgi:membrane fusion protein, multidrug efflux system
MSTRLRRIGAIAAGLVVVTGGAALYFHSVQPPSSPARSGGAAGVPVSIAVAGRQDVPIYLTGIGSVQAYFTVDIHAKVDGELQEIKFTEGQHVHKSDVLAKIDPRLYRAALDQTQARRAQDAATLNGAEKDLARAKGLALKSFDTQQNVDQQQAKVDHLKAAILADEAAIEAAQALFDYTTIVAPSDGRIGIRLVDPGNMIRALDSKSLATLVLTQPATVVFSLPATALGEVRAALKRGPVEVTALDQNNRAALATGNLLLIDNVIDQAAAAIRLKALFPNEDDALWPGDFVNARILVDTRRGALVVPSSAIQSGPQGLFAWVVGNDNTVEPRAIEVGPATDSLTIIAGGLAEGERIVTAGHYKLRAKARVVMASLPPGPASRGAK